LQPGHFLRLVAVEIVDATDFGTFDAAEQKEEEAAGTVAVTKVAGVVEIGVDGNAIVANDIATDAQLFIDALRGAGGQAVADIAAIKRTKQVPEAADALIVPVNAGVAPSGAGLGGAGGWAAASTDRRKATAAVFVQHESRRVSAGNNCIQFASGEDGDRKDESENKLLHGGCADDNVLGGLEGMQFGKIVTIYSP
jgi:hypothetical protein